MKILVVTLMLIVVKGIEAHALPDERVNSDVAVNAGGGNSKDLEPEPEPVKPIMKIQNPLENTTTSTRELQQEIETSGTNVEEQAGTQGGVIPKDESKSNKLANWQQLFWDLLTVSSDVAKIAIDILEQPEVAQSATVNLSSTTEHLDTWIENSMNYLSSLMENLQWKGVSISDHIETQANLFHAWLISAGEQLHEANGDETFSAIHKNLEMRYKDIRQYSQNLSLITDHFNQTYEDATHQLEEWYKEVTPYAEELREEMSELIEELRQYLSPMVHETKEDAKNLAIL